ncbi:DNA (cytosine-5)-methyltransferase DRM2 isoform X1 [Juglans regia]|uniref:DNA (cytosine-5-)-methyltransferase n=1 Tax=Juglans regia TaxID=51240 RepID=A0A6P9EPY4_JUGRE|nr:DNA (cytosine-5)-methyltransferase DRM2 isoform X1 [Juglans regia]
MNGDASGVGGENFDWNTDDELEVNDFSLSSCSSLTPPNGEAVVGCGEARSTAGCSNSKLIDHFIGMGFSKKMVSKAIQENGEENTDSILETLLTYSAIESSPRGQHDVDSDNSSLDSGGSFLDDFSDIDSSSDTEEIMIPESDVDGKLLSLVKMGYTVDEASIAIERCGQNSSLVELTDFICAAQMAKVADAHFPELPLEVKPKLKHCDFSKHKKRKLSDYAMWKKKRRNGVHDDDDETIHLPNPMTGFGAPGEPCQTISRTLPEAAVGPPFFYYENVALAPKGVWTTISRFLYDVEPEFVDSKYFCAAARKRGYVHNLPIENRFPLLPLPPRTIHEALPLTRKWWPSWDQRTKLNCIQTCIGSAKLTERIRKALEDYDGEPPLRVQKYVLDECRKWNLVWVGRNKVAPLEPDEVEMLLGFPRNHTRGGGISRTDRYKSLGNSFQVDTVAYHLSVLKDMFPGGINLLSLFSGIGGAEVALHRLGIRLKNVVSVEISEVNRNILRCWWEQTNQRGNLIDLADVQQLNGDRLEQMMSSFGGFDLVVGGSPCNNLAGSNRHHRDGLEVSFNKANKATFCPPPTKPKKIKATLENLIGYFVLGARSRVGSRCSFAPTQENTWLWSSCGFLMVYSLFWMKKDGLYYYDLLDVCCYHPPCCYLFEGLEALHSGVKVCCEEGQYGCKPLSLFCSLGYMSHGSLYIR